MSKLGIAKIVKSHKAPVITERYILENLRKNYSKVTEHVLGDDYYNIGCDVYTCDDFTCNDLIEAYDELKKAKNIWFYCTCSLFGIIIITCVVMVAGAIICWRRS